MAIDGASGRADVVEEGLVVPPIGFCFHCGEVLPAHPFGVMILGKTRDMCCMGCQLAGQSIVEAGLSQYYLDRQSINKIAPMPNALNFAQYDHEGLKKTFTYSDGDALVAELSVLGLRCAACAWLIESRLMAQQGVRLCQVNVTSGRMQVAWYEQETSISVVLQAVYDIGYDARPYRQDTHEAGLKKHNKTLLIRLGVAAIGAMQAMMFSVGIYFGDYSGMDENHREFLRYVAMVVSIPVLIYAAKPFFASALTAIRLRQVNMDIPVSVALLLTFTASVFAVWTNSGETYFDSVAMFVFFLLAGRYVESNARLKASMMASDLLTVTPKLVKKLGHDPTLLTQIEQGSATIDTLIRELPSDGEAVIEVVRGDIVQVAAGDELIADGILLSDNAKVSQSLLTGEGDLVSKYRFDTLLGGSQNDAKPLVMVITNQAKDSQLALIDRLMSRASSEKPKIAQEADKMARWFVGRVLVLSLLVFCVWWWIDPSRAIWATVAVLVATCPCALSLATPIALTVATSRLGHYQFLATRGHTITTLAQIDTIAFDKTGTLTTGTPTLQERDYFDTGDPLAIAAALEVGSHHPIAKSLLVAAHGKHLPKTQKLTHHAGGVSALIDGVEYRLGHRAFALAEVAPKSGYGFAIALTKWAHGRFCQVAWFYFNDVVRTDTAHLLNELKKRKLNTVMLTGDPSESAKQLGQTLSITAMTGLLPEDKVDEIKKRQALGNKVLMVGDGINDAPVLAAADVSVSLATGADLAQVAGDGVLLSDTLMPILKAVDIAQKTQAIIRQNLRWAFFYNSMVIIPAALGYVPPWLAAIGMSLSSVLVVLNALRIRRL